jgi:hypothetical protein
MPTYLAKVTFPHQELRILNSFRGMGGEINLAASADRGVTGLLRVQCVVLCQDLEKLTRIRQKHC